MVNLLTISEKKHIAKDYKTRRAVVALFMLSFLIIIAIVFLVPSYFVSVLKYNNNSKQLELEKSRVSSFVQKESTLKIIKSTNSKLDIFESFKPSLIKPYDVIILVIKHKPEGVHLNTILLDKNKEEEKITISGVAEDRETLLSFLRLMESEKEFSKVGLPISSFVKGENIVFSMSVVIKKVNKKEDEKK